MDADSIADNNGLAKQLFTDEYSFAVRVINCALGIVLLSLIIASNAFVLIVFAKEPRLRRESNWFVVSLAIADFLVGLIIMPQTVTYKFLGYWPFGVLMCEVWLALDVLLCTASILLIVQIALDRFIALRFPLYYLSCKRSRFAISLIVGAWVIAFLIALPPLVGWRPTRTEGECMLSQDIGYVLYSSLGSFFIPVLCLIVLYTVVLRVTIMRANRIRRKLKNCHQICTSVVKPLGCMTTEVKAIPTVAVTDSYTPSPSPEPEAHHQLRADCLTPERERKISTISQLEQIVEADEERGNDGPKENSLQQALKSIRSGENLLRETEKSVSFNEITEKNARRKNGIVGWAASRRRSTHAHSKRLSVFQKRLRSIKEKERQSVTMLGTIIVTFIVCWLPFFLIYVLEAFGHKAPPLVFDAFFLLGYYNSAANPLIYGFLNAEFKAAFRRSFQKLNCDAACASKSEVDNNSSCSGHASVAAAV